MVNLSTPLSIRYAVSQRQQRSVNRYLQPRPNHDGKQQPKNQKGLGRKSNKKFGVQKTKHRRTTKFA